MVFSSITFLFAFLPAVLLAYYISPRIIKNFILLVFSLLFYAWGEPKYIVIMVISILIGYVMGILIDLAKDKGQEKKAKLLLTVDVVINIGILFYFKYIGFATENINKIPGVNINIIDIALPIGISFYTFQILSYAIDVYSGKAKVQKNIINLGAYITLFPQLIAGPIVRYETVAEQLDSRKETIDDFGEGAKRFIIGLAKKVLIANTASEIFENLSALSKEDNSVMLAWICAIAFTLRIYFDFAGYSDMAIGLGRMFGFEFLENFNYPYISKSITEFWRRWHISLSTWFRDYVYIPMGGNRGGKLKTIRNIFIVWLLTGFWHGAAWNFVIWGLYYFVLLISEKLWLGKLLERIPNIFSRIYALFFINLGWVIFAYDDFGKLGSALSNMFGFGGLKFSNELTIFTILSYGVFFLIAFVASTPIPKKLWNKLCDKVKTMEIVEVILLFGVLILSTAFLASDAFNPFLYFRF
ncbi:MAG: MBOAT family protein [Lachnospiraceae bacterium]|nr:MBOAT family protein [Lachnospiraceae bacterium]